MKGRLCMMAVTTQRKPKFELGATTSCDVRSRAGLDGCGVRNRGRSRVGRCWSSSASRR